MNDFSTLSTEHFYNMKPLGGKIAVLELSIFQTLQFTVLGLFIVYISDFRRKGNMVPLIKERWTYLLKVSYFLPLATYVYVLLTLNALTVFDFVGFAVTLIGTAVVIQAKRDLATHHTWVGYCLPTTKFTSNGIYAYIRHPLYTGIYVMVLGTFFTIIPHANWHTFTTLATAAAMCMIYIMTFLALLANKETRLLAQKHGEPFQHYRRQVHPFLPLKKYVPKT
jgi:protein-S-isoprenylcysteine O-methyltransferase Ste14